MRAVGRACAIEIITTADALRLVHQVVARQPFEVWRALSFGGRSPRDSSWGPHGDLYAVVAAPAGEWIAIADRVLDLRLELEEQPLVERVDIVPFREPTTAGYVNRDGYLIELAGESWTIRFSLPVWVTGELYV